VTPDDPTYDESADDDGQEVVEAYHDDGQDDGQLDARDDHAQVEDDSPFDAGGTTHDVPEVPLTGDAGVDEAVVRLAEAARGPLDGQVAAYDAAHRALQDRLADVEG
jgi:hypothetical protein